MAASYPGAIKSFSAITLGATVIQQSLFDDAVVEAEAIETEMGTLVNGSAGSLAERLNMAMDLEGVPHGLIRLFGVGATAGFRKRIRCGITQVLCSSLTPITYGARGTITFAPALQTVCHALCKLQLVEIDASANTMASFVGYIRDSGTTTAFDYMVSDGLNSPPDTTTSFLLHWVAYEKDYGSAATPL